MHTDQHEPAPWIIDGADESEIHECLAAHAARWLFEVGMRLEADGFPRHVADEVLERVRPIVEQHCERHLPELLETAGASQATRH